MNCIFLAISEVRDSWRLAKERGPLYPEVFIRGRQTFHGLCTFNKGLSTTTISSSFHGHLTCIELLALFKGLHQSCSSYELKSTKEVWVLVCYLLVCGFQKPVNLSELWSHLFKKEGGGHLIVCLNVSSKPKIQGSWPLSNQLI